MKIGQGWDLHRLVPGRKLILGGVAVPNDRGCLAHSDGDVLAHALTDALLGALGLGDIGSHFPPEDPQWKDADSLVLLAKAAALVKSRGYEVGNADCTVILESPKLGSLKTEMERNLEEALSLKPGSVSVKAKTAEGTGPAGRGEAVEAQAVVLLVPFPR